MTPVEQHLDKASRIAERVRDLIARPATLDSYDWSLAATLLIEADDALQAARSLDPSAQSPLFDEVLEDLRDTTSNFTNAEFLKATRPERRQKPALFAPLR